MVIVKWLDKNSEKVLLLFFSTIMVLATAVQVFMRFVLGSSLSWSEELARFSFIWLIYIGISYAVLKQRHISVDVLAELLKGKSKIILKIISYIIFLAFAIFIIIYGHDYAIRLLESGQTSPSLNIPMGLVYYAAPIGMGLTAIRLIQQIVLLLMTLFGKSDFKVKTESDIHLESETNHNE